MEMQYLTVSLVADYIKNSIAHEELLHNITILGEVSGCKNSGNHSYFTLKDDKAQLACNNFNYITKYKVKDGEQVLATGSISFYPPYGKLSFNVDNIVPIGSGLLAIKLEKLKLKLKEEGLFDDEHKKSIPMYCKRVGVVTSKTGAVIKDIITTVRKYNQIIDIIICDTKVQGANAEMEIVKSLLLTDSMGYDCIILARGGGSFEDLMPFNGESLARTIYSLKTPIISAVGHETDFSICDFVADARAATPTAAAELIAFDTKSIFYDLIAKNNLIRKKIALRLQNNSLVLNNNIHLIVDKINSIYTKCNLSVNLVVNNIKSAINKQIINNEHRLDIAIKGLDDRSPLKLIQKGYFKVKVNNKLLSNDTIINIGDELEVISNDKTIQSIIKEVKYNGWNEF